MILLKSVHKTNKNWNDLIFITEFWFENRWLVGLTRSIKFTWNPKCWLIIVRKWVAHTILMRFILMWTPNSRPRKWSIQTHQIKYLRKKVNHYCLWTKVICIIHVHFHLYSRINKFRWCYRSARARCLYWAG